MIDSLFDAEGLCVYVHGGNKLKLAGGSCGGDSVAPEAPATALIPIKRLNSV